MEIQINLFINANVQWAMAIVEGKASLTPEEIKNIFLKTLENHIKQVMKNAALEQTKCETAILDAFNPNEK